MFETAQKIMSSHELIQNSITAAAGLLGVFVGGWFTGRQQKKERQNARCREQLMGFYAPLRGMRAEIRAKSELRLKLHGMAGASWAAQFLGADDADRKAEIDKTCSPEYRKFFDYGNEQLTEDLVPLYRRMLAEFSKNMGLAEVSTLAYYRELVEFVEVWNRWLKSSLPGDVVTKIDHSEKKLYPLYDDIEKHFKELSASLKK
jgi:hypothetical protein